MSDMRSQKQEYGTSSSLCDYILEHQLQQLQPLQVVDFGAGSGKNGRIARRALQDGAKLIAVEGCENSARMLSNEGPYDEVHQALIQEWIFNDTNNYDLAVFGDVLEHLKPREIHAVIGKSLEKFKHIVLACPLHEIFQESNYDNELEIHQTYVTSNFFDRYNVIEKHILKGKDWTIMNVRILAEREPPEPIWRRFSWFVFHRTMLILQPLGLARTFVNVLKRYAMKFKWLLRN